MTEDALVMTPYGLVPRSKIVAISKDETVKVIDGHLKKADLRTNEVTGDFGPVPGQAESADPYAYAASLRGETENLQQKAGDVHWASDDSIKHILTFSATWQVPSRPIGDDSKGWFSLWNGLQRGGLQPVLEWNNGFGSVYGIRNWAFIAGYYIHGSLVRDLAPGTSLTGVISFKGIEVGHNIYHKYLLSFPGYPEADFTVMRSSEANGVCLCFEPYRSSSPPYASACPPDRMVSFNEINLQLIPPNPTPSKINWGAGKCMVVVDSSSSHGEVDCYFKNCPNT